MTGSASPGEDDPDEEQLFRDLWEEETQREVVIESLKADYEVRVGGLQALEISQSILHPTCMQSQVTYCDVYYYYCRRQRWRPKMAVLRCTCEQGTNLWGEFWWIEGKHRWVFFDDEKTSETYAEQLTHCPGCGSSLERKALRATTPSFLTSLG